MTRTLAAQRQLVRPLGICLKFDGTNDFITVTGSSSINVSVFTYAAWINVLGTSNRAIIGGTKSSGTRCPEFRIENTNKLELLEQSVASIATSTGTIPLGIWTHVGITYSVTGVYTFYINGIASGTGTSLRSFQFTDLLIGKQLVGENFKNKMNDLRIYGRVLSPTEMLNLYYGIEPAITNLGGWWKLNEGSGTSAIDSSGNGNTGVITTATYSTDGFTKLRTTAGIRTVVNMPRFLVDYKNAYLPLGWDTVWQSAKSSYASSSAHMAFFGDSIIAGGNSSDYNSKGYPELVRTNLLSTYSKCGDFYSTTQSAAWSAYTGTPPFVFNVTSGLTFNAHGWNKAPAWNGTPATPSLTFTTPYACTDIDIYYWDVTNNLTWTYNVDAAGAVTVTTGEPVNQVIKKITLTGLANTTHTIVFGNQSATNACVILGCATYTSRTTGIGFARFGYPPAQANDYVSNSTFPNEDRISLFAGSNPLVTPPNGTYTFGFPTQPHLAIIAFGVNDCTNSVSTTTFSTILQRFITALRLGRANCSIILLANCMPDTAHSDVVSGVTNGANWQNYIDKMLTLAQNNNCAFVNISERWGDTPAGKTFMLRNNVHPTDAGHQDIANLLNSII